MLGGEFDDRGELLVLLLLEADIARIDAVFGERLAAGGMIGEKLVADVVEIADERDVASLLGELFENMRHCRRRLVAVNGDAHQLGPLLRQRQNLRHGRFDIRRIGIGHGLHDDRRAAAHHHGGVAGADRDRAGAMAGRRLSGDRIGQAGLLSGFVHRVALAVVRTPIGRL